MGFTVSRQSSKEIRMGPSSPSRYMPGCPRTLGCSNLHVLHSWAEQLAKFCPPLRMRLAGLC